MLDFSGKSAKKRCTSHNVISLVITVVVVTIVILAGSTSAVNINFSLTGDGGDGTFDADSGENVIDFSFDVDIGDNEHVPLNNFTLEILGPYNLSCNFSVDGRNNCEYISISETLLGESTNETGFGYGYGSVDGISPYNYSNISFGFGYGFTGEGLEYQYDIEWNIGDAGITSDEEYDGEYEARIYAHAKGEDGKYVYVSDLLEFQTEAESSSPSSSSGGGGIGVPSSGSEGSAVVTKYWDKIGEGDEEELEIEGNASIKKVKFVALGEIRNVQMKIRATDNPRLIATNNPGKVYEYFEIEHSFDNSEISGGEIEFDVKSNWLSENGISKEEVVLYRHNPTTRLWESLETKFLGMGEELAKFKATSPGFSVFAVGVDEIPDINETIETVRNITADNNTSEATPVTEETTEVEDDVEETEENVADDVVKPDTEAPKKQSRSYAWLWTLIFVIIVAGLLGYALLNTRKDLKTYYDADLAVKEVDEILREIEREENIQVVQHMQELKEAFLERDYFRFHDIFKEFYNLYPDIADKETKKKYHDSVMRMLKILSKRK